jgi:segregation and condensation protein A
MSYQVKLPVFQGPFDLLLNLISRRKVDIYEVPLAEITEEYLGYLDQMRQLDLEIASDFILVAATLLQIKSAALLPQQAPVDDEDETLSAFEQRQLLIGRLIEYRKFKNAASMLGGRLKTEAHFFTRRAALEPQYDNLLPDFLAGIGLPEFGSLMNKLLDRERVRLVDSSHIATVKISIESRMDEVLSRLSGSKRLLFKDLTTESDRANVVATFLAVLELYKRGLADVRQRVAFGDIEITRLKAN